MPLQKCTCSPLDVLGWTGAKVRTGPDDFDDGRFGNLSAVKVPAVYARYTEDNAGVAERSLPPKSSEGAWEIPLPVFVDAEYLPYWEHSQYDGRYACTLWGSFPFLYNGQWHAAYPMGCYNDHSQATLFEGGDRFTHVHILNLQTKTLERTFYLPMINPAIATPHWYAQYIGTLNGGQHPTYNPAFFGWSGDSWIICAKYGDGTPFFQRHRFSTGESCIALGSYAVVEGDCIIELPARTSNDGLPWVIAVKRDGIDRGVYTGPWTNDNVGDLTNPTAFNAILTPEERLNRLDDKPGWDAAIDWAVEFEVISYTRTRGYDYVVIRFPGEPGDPDRVRWYDGRRERWNVFGDEEDGSDTWYPDAVLDCADGSVVLANANLVEYYNAGGERIWRHIDNTAANGPMNGIYLSDNGGWIMVANALGSRMTIFHPASTTLLSKFGTEAWSGNYTDYPANTDPFASLSNSCLAWSLSKKPRDDGTPVAIPHREYDTQRWFPSYHWQYFEEFETELYVINPAYAPEDSYTQRWYCGNPQMKWAGYTSGLGTENGHQHLMYGGWSPVPWALFPCCCCCGGGATFNLDGY